MAESIQEERWRWLKPIINKEMRLVDVAKVCPYSARSLKRWKHSYEKKGMDGLAPRSTRPKRSPDETSIRVKEEVIALRKETGLCAQKLHWRLKKQGLTVPVRTIGKILKDEGLVRKYRVKKVQYKYLKAVRKPGELIEIDVKHVPGRVAGKRYFQYTAIDCASRWRYLRIFEEESSFHSVMFLADVLNRFPYPVTGVKTDNHTTFTNRYVGGLAKRSDRTPVSHHALDVFCAERGIVHYLIDPGKPAQNGTVERSHREDNRKLYVKTFKTAGALRRAVRHWNDAYNNLEHCSLGGKTPNEVLFEKVPKVIA